MIKIRFLSSAEKKRLLEVFEEKFGISELPYLLIEGGKEKIRAFSGSLSKDEMQHLSEILRVEIIGLYLARKEAVDYRIAYDASILLKDKISNNTLEINQDQFHLWIRGHDLNVKTPKGPVIIKYNDDVFGCGLSNGEKVFNYVPKDRRLKKPM